MLEQLKAAVKAAFPGIDAPKTAVYRVVRAIGGRLNLQSVFAPDKAPDLAPVEVRPGVPGVTSDPTPGEDVVVAFIGDDATPCVIARASEQGTGAIPIEVRHDATTAIRLISRTGSSGAKVYVGAAPTFALARAADLQNLATRITSLGAALELSPDPSAAIVGAAITAAMTGYTVTPTTKLEAQ